jgi:hypothetical protein
MKHVVVAILFCVAKSYANPVSHLEIRALYQKAALEEKYCMKLISLLEPFNEHNNALFCGYKASATIIKAKYVHNPLTKHSLFSSGKDMLEKLINADRNNVELRFLRFTIQSKIPKYLKYNESIEEDKALLLQSIPEMKDANLKQMIATFLMDSNSLNVVEKSKLKSWTRI